MNHGLHIQIIDDGEMTLQFTHCSHITGMILYFPGKAATTDCMSCVHLADHNGARLKAVTSYRQNTALLCKNRF